MKNLRLIVGSLLTFFSISANSALLTSSDDSLLFWYDNDVSSLGGIQLAQNQSLGVIDPYSGGDFTVSFYLNIQGTVSNWGSVLHVGNMNQQRWPGFWLTPGGTSLHSRISTSGSWNNGFGDTTSLGIDGAAWRHIVMTDSGNDLSLFIDGALIQTISGVNTPFTGTETSINVFAGDPWYQSAVGRIDDIRIYDRAVSLNELSATPSPSVDVPEPGSLALLGLGLLAMRRINKR